MQNLGDGHDTPRSAFSVRLGFVLASTRNATLLELCRDAAAPTLGACATPVMKDPATTAAHTVTAALTRGPCIATLRRRPEGATPVELSVRWRFLNMRNNLTAIRHASDHVFTTASQFTRECPESARIGLLDTACFLHGNHHHQRFRHRA